jgi:hypothetical protein
VAQNLINLPQGAEVWRVGADLWVVYYVPNTNPPVPMGWKVPPSEVAALGISGQDRTMSADQFFSTGVLDMGVTTEIPRTAEGVHPFDIMVREYQQEVQVKPWLADPEILAIWAEAAMEGRQISDADLQLTEWWRTHNAQERAWITLNATDPATANQVIADNRLNVMNMMQEAGIDNASVELINFVADQWTTGNWTQAYAMTQINGLADPYARVELDPDLAQYAAGLDTSQGREMEVRDLVNLWLGPAYAAGWTSQNIAQWAGEFRNNPDAETELTEILRGQRMALFPEYTNPNLTYEDIAGAWRGVWQSAWGEMPDESNPLFTQIVRMNDITSANRLLRQEGLKVGNATVSQSLLGDIAGAFGGNIYRTPEFR